MSTVGFKPAKAEIKYPPQVMLFWDSMGQGSGTSREKRTGSARKISVLSIPQMSSGLPHGPSQNSAPVKKGHSRSTLRDANHAGQEHCCLFILRKIKFSSKGQYTLLHLIGTQKKWELNKENSLSYVFKRILATWHPKKLNTVRTGNGKGSPRGSLPDQTCSHRWTAGWLSGLWWSSPWPSYSGKVPETREGNRELDPCSDTESLLEHNKTEHVFMGSWVVSGRAAWPLTAGL